MFFTIIAGDLDCPKIGRSACALYQRVNREQKLKMPSVDLKRHPVVEPIRSKSDHWSFMVGDGLATLEKKPDVELRNALDDLFAKGGVIECSIMRKLAMYHVALECFPSTIKIFQKQKHVGMNMKNPVYDMIAPKTVKDAPVGSFLSIYNVLDYSSIHPLGFSACEHMCVIGKNEKGEKLYIGFGEGFAQPKTLKEINDLFYQSLFEAISAGNIEYIKRAKCVERFNTDPKFEPFREEPDTAQMCLNALLKSDEFKEDVSDAIQNAKNLQAKYKDRNVFDAEIAKVQSSQIRASVLKKEYRYLES